MTIDWACDFCGELGQTFTDQTVDSLQCPTCGEPVTLISERR